MINSLITYIKIWIEVSYLLVQNEQHIPLKEKIRHALHGSLKPTDALLLRKILLNYKPDNILEIGSFIGVSSRWILDVAKEWEGHLTAIDPNIPHRVFVNPQLYMKRLNKRHIPHNLDIVTAFLGEYGGTCLSCLTPENDQYDKRQFDDIESIDGNWERRFDLIFIDGEHSYEAVMNNFEICIKLLNKGGCIVFHDVLSREGVIRALRDIELSYKGVAEIRIMGERDRRLLGLIGRANDGIGFFRYL